MWTRARPCTRVPVRTRAHWAMYPQRLPAHSTRPAPPTPRTVHAPHRRRTTPPAHHTAGAPHRRRATPPARHTTSVPHHQRATPPACHTTSAPHRQRATLPARRTACAPLRRGATPPASHTAGAPHRPRVCAPALSPVRPSTRVHFFSRHPCARAPVYVTPTTPCWGASKAHRARTARWVRFPLMRPSCCLLHAHPGGPPPSPLNQLPPPHFVPPLCCFFWLPCHDTAVAPCFRVLFCGLVSVPEQLPRFSSLTRSLHQPAASATTIVFCMRCCTSTRFLCGHVCYAPLMEETRVLWLFSFWMSVVTTTGLSCPFVNLRLFHVSPFLRPLCTTYDPLRQPPVALTLVWHPPSLVAIPLSSPHRHPTRLRGTMRLALSPHALLTMVSRADRDAHCSRQCGSGECGCQFFSLSPPCQLPVLLFPFCLFHDSVGTRTGKHDQKINEAALGNECTELGPRIGGVEGWRRGIHGRCGGLLAVRGGLVGGVDDVCVASRLGAVLWRGDGAPV